MLLSNYHLFQAFITKAGMFKTLRINFEYCLNNVALYLKVNLTSQSKNKLIL